MRHALLSILVLVSIAAGWPAALHAQAATLPQLVLIIDDIGDNLALGRRAVDLPGAVAIAVLPHTTHSHALAERAANRGKVVMLHVPMSSHAPHRRGPGTLSPDMDRSRFLKVLRADLAAVPHASGVNNHMGSELTEHPLPMSWLMGELDERGLFFVDSRTTPRTTAEYQASAHGLPHLRRHVFLDHDRSPAEIERQFERWLALAHTQGLAVAIGHPYPETLALLEQRLPGLLLRGVQLVSVAEAAAMGPARSSEGHEIYSAKLSPAVSTGSDKVPSASSLLALMQAK